MRTEEENQLCELVTLYTKTKKLVLLAEQLDTESKSNIAIFKEQRDALDHLMRALEEALPPSEGKKPNGYFRLQLDKARGHLFRAAYDALDGLAVSCKFRIKEAMEGISIDAIRAVYPDYYTHLVEVERIDRVIADRRNAKDIGGDSLQNLAAYHDEVEKLCSFVKDCQSRTRALWDWQERDSKSKLKEKLFWPLVLAVIVSVVNAWLK